MVLLRMLLFVALLVIQFSDDAKAVSFSDTDSGAAFIGPLCNIVVKIQGPWGRALLVVGAIFVGVNVFIGKFSFPMLIGFVAAGALILSPEAVINVMGGTSFNCMNYVTNSN